MQMTSDFARDFNNEVHENPPEENVRDTSDEINESTVKKDSLLSSLHPEIVITYACHLSPKFLSLSLSLSLSVCLSLSLSSKVILYEFIKP